ncbi:hypothetical protein SNE40_014609 [Patella caerulea]|uniref:Uncharacterized protein n=1 Tax=Patella caerulea TaxID=87958 RepID=A0AAN8JET0_PATCE
MLNFEHKDELAALLSMLQSGPNEETWKEMNASDAFNQCLASYSSYADVTRAGGHGATAKYWLIYVDFIHHFHNLERAIRTNSVDLFLRALPPLIDLLFYTNHANYSRWLLKFQLDLVNVHETHPGLRSILENGVFTVKRTQKAFSRGPVDLTLEQTVNADAASRKTGLSSVTNSYSARMRWMLTKSARVQEMVGLSHVDDPTAEFKGARLKRDNRGLRHQSNHRIVQAFQHQLWKSRVSGNKSQPSYNNGKGQGQEGRGYRCMF